MSDAFYFKATWKYAFKQKNTLPQQFNRFGNENNPQMVPFMHTNGEFGHGADEDTQIFELPYTHPQLTMYIFSPKMEDGLQSFEKSLSGEKMRKLIKSIEYNTMSLEMPKFNMRLKIDLKAILINMGLRAMFDKKTADFSRLSDNVNDPLYVAKAVHEAFLSVSENGTDAGAATAYVMSFKSAFPTITIDHPFVYAIMHKKTTAIIFMGKVNEIEETPETTTPEKQVDKESKKPIESTATPTPDAGKTTEDLKGKGNTAEGNKGIKNMINGKMIMIVMIIMQMIFETKWKANDLGLSKKIDLR